MFEIFKDLNVSFGIVHILRNSLGSLMLREGYNFSHRKSDCWRI
jgi:hypothetical protein